MVPNTLHPYILYDFHNTLGHNGPTRLYHFIRRHYYQKKLCQHCNKYICSYSECQQVTLKEPQYINLHLPILQFLMSFISMDLVDPYREIENGNLYVLTAICMLTNYLHITLHPYMQFGNRTDALFSKGIYKKTVCNHQIDWDETVHIAAMAYNIFPHSSAGESPFYLMFRCDPFMPTLFKLLLPKLRYIGDE